MSEKRHKINKFSNYQKKIILLMVRNSPAFDRHGFVFSHSRPQSASFLGHVVGKRGALEAAVTGCQKISDIRSRMCRRYKYHCSCS